MQENNNENEKTPNENDANEVMQNSENTETNDTEKTVSFFIFLALNISFSAIPICIAERMESMVSVKKTFPKAN